MKKGLEKFHRGATPLLLGIVALFSLRLFFDTNMQWELKVAHSAAEALTGVYLFYWATRWLIEKRLHELDDPIQKRYRELVLIAGAALVVAGALSG